MSKRGPSQSRYSSGYARRLPVVVLLVLALAATGATRYWAESLRRDPRETASRGAALGQLDSFALGLLLGGLRGPLVMALWASSETQKQDRDLRDFDTKINLIRLLQPQFDTVHLFQIWNKAYNVSVQMANLPNKYAVILDALDYGFDVRKERPDSINLEAAVANVLFGKFGEAAEKGYYRQRVRAETMAAADLTRITFPESRRAALAADAAQVGLLPTELMVRSVPGEPDARSVTVTKFYGDLLAKTFAGPGIEYVDRPARQTERDETGRRVKYDTLLDRAGNLLPAFTTPREPGEPQSAELYYLVPFEPFPEGVSPLALAYDYYKRAQFLQNERGQVHAQLSPRVLDSRPAVALGKWSDAERERGRRAELAAMDRPVPEDAEQREAAAADLPPDSKIGQGGLSRALLKRAVYDYRRTAFVAGKTVDEFAEHFARDRGDSTGQDEVDRQTLVQAMTGADADYLAAMLADGGPRGPAGVKLLASAKAGYEKALRLVELQALRYYVNDRVLSQFYPPGVDRPGVDRRSKLDALTDPQLAALYEQSRAFVHQRANLALYQQQVDDYGYWRERIQTRLGLLGVSGVAGPSTKASTVPATSPVGPVAPVGP